MVNAKTQDWQSVKNKSLLLAQSQMGHQQCPLKAQETSKSRWKEPEDGKYSMKDYHLDMTWLLHPWTHSTGRYLLKAGLISSPSLGL